MNFTNSPFERIMKEVPRPCRGAVRKPPAGCRNCDYWNGVACLGVCYRDLLVSRRDERDMSGQHGPLAREGTVYGIDEI
jgi:hypothetical protein